MSEDKLEEIKKRSNNLCGEYLYGIGPDRAFYKNADDDIDCLRRELEKCRGEILELADQVKWLRHIWAQDKAELEKCRDSKYALSGLVDRSRRQADYWRKRAKKAEAKNIARDKPITKKKPYDDDHMTEADYQTWYRL